MASTTSGPPPPQLDVWGEVCDQGGGHKFNPNRDCAQAFAAPAAALKPLSISPQGPGGNIQLSKAQQCANYLAVRQEVLRVNIFHPPLTSLQTTKLKLVSVDVDYNPNSTINNFYFSHLLLEPGQFLPFASRTPNSLHFRLQNCE